MVTQCLSPSHFAINERAGLRREEAVLCILKPTAVKAHSLSSSTPRIPGKNLKLDIADS